VIARRFSLRHRHRLRVWRGVWPDEAASESIRRVVANPRSRRLASGRVGPPRLPAAEPTIYPPCRAALTIFHHRPVKKKGGTAAGVPRSLGEANATLNNGAPKDSVSHVSLIHPRVYALHGTRPGLLAMPIASAHAFPSKAQPGADLARLASPGARFGRTAADCFGGGRNARRPDKDATTHQGNLLVAAINPVWSYFGWPRAFASACVS